MRLRWVGRHCWGCCACKAGGKLLVGAAGVFVLSMAVQALDQPMCEHWPIGTHFIWHLLNALVLWMTLRGFLQGVQARDSSF